tara:strand:- start:378 stop:1100 length:723 start_codon:yes stop_codon:yes gene_type:complete
MAKKNTSGFKMRSGNGPLQFKQMGSSPAKDVGEVFQREGTGDDFKYKKMEDGTFEYEDKKTGEWKPTKGGAESDALIQKGYDKKFPASEDDSDDKDSTTPQARMSEGSSDVSTDPLGSEETSFWAKDSPKRKALGGELEKLGTAIGKAGGSGSIMAEYQELDREEEKQKQEERRQESQEILDRSRELNNMQKIENLKKQGIYELPADKSNSVDNKGNIMTADTATAETIYQKYYSKKKGE